MATTEKQQEWNLYQHKAELEVATESVRLQPQKRCWL